MSKQPIYLDYAAATPLDERVLAVMQPYWSEQFYNPSAAYMPALQVRRDIEAARDGMAKLLGVKSAELIFTAGATESIAIAIQSVCRAYPGAKVLTTAIEHPAVLENIKRAEHFEIIPVTASGRVDVEILERAITDETVLVSVGYVNNELGTIQPLKVIAKLLQSVREKRRRAGIAMPLFFHTDASQAIGHVDIHVSRLGVDMMTLNAGKAYGPKQVGLLFAASHVPLAAMVPGGGQERNVRSGTENVAGAIGMAKAFQLAEEMRHDENNRLVQLRRYIGDALVQGLSGTVMNGDIRHASPHVLSLSFEGVDGERLLMQLDGRGILVSTGSACAANKDTKSHVLEAIRLSDEQIAGSLRLSFGRTTTQQELQQAADTIIKLVKKQRERKYV